jgi:hypothetical protein
MMIGTDYLTMIEEGSEECSEERCGESCFRCTDDIDFATEGLGDDGYCAPDCADCVSAGDAPMRDCATCGGYWHDAADCVAYVYGDDAETLWNREALDDRGYAIDCAVADFLVDTDAVADGDGDARMAYAYMRMILDTYRERFETLLAQ